MTSGARVNFPKILLGKYSRNGDTLTDIFILSIDLFAYSIPAIFSYRTYLSLRFLEAKLSKHFEIAEDFLAIHMNDLSARDPSHRRNSLDF